MLAIQKPQMRFNCDSHSPKKPWRLLRWAAVLWIASSIPSICFAWQRECTHPKITDNALKLLYDQETLRPLFPEFNLAVSSGSIEAGTVAEDFDPTGYTAAIVFNHFYDPRT